MKFSSLTIILIICCLFLNLSSSLAKENNIKVQKTNNLKAKKIADSSTIKKSAIKIKKLETRNSTSTTGMYVGALIDSNWKYQGPEAKKDYSKMEKVSSNKRFEQAKNINNTIFSIGNSAIVSKIFDSFLGDIFKKEASEAYQSFSNGKKILEKELSQGFADNNWKIYGSLEDLGSLFYNTYSGNKKSGLKESEFVFMMIACVFEYNVNYDCKNCLQESRKEIKKLFSFLDCDSKGFVHAINLYDVMKQMKGAENLKSVNVNEWLLKEDYRSIGRLDSKQFTEGVLKTLYEMRYLK